MDSIRKILTFIRKVGCIIIPFCMLINIFSNTIFLKKSFSSSVVFTSRKLAESEMSRRLKHWLITEIGILEADLFLERFSAISISTTTVGDAKVEKIRKFFLPFFLMET